MFSGCSSLTSLDLSYFNTPEVTDIVGMFYGCTSLLSLDLSNFNTLLVSDMRNMFSGCSFLTSLDLSNFNTSLVSSMDNILYGCSSLKSLDISNLIISQKNLNTMLSQMNSNLIICINEIKAKEITTKNFTIECNKSKSVFNSECVWNDTDKIDDIENAQNTEYIENTDTEKIENTENTENIENTFTEKIENTENS